jgi:hypothetical protein
VASTENLESAAADTEEKDKRTVEVMGIEWKKLCHLSFDTTEDIKNVLDGNRRVNAALDGQEVSPEAAEKLMSIMKGLDEETIETLTKKLEEPVPPRKRLTSEPVQPAVDDSKRKKGKLYIVRVMRTQYCM